MTIAADQPVPPLDAAAVDLAEVPAVAAPAPRAGVDLVHGPDGPVVAVVGEPSRRTAAVLSCRLHEAIDTAAAGSDLVVDLGAASAADPAVERVLLCARESATDRGLGFRLR